MGVFYATLIPALARLLSQSQSRLYRILCVGRPLTLYLCSRFNLAASGLTDYYDVSLVDGHPLPASLLGCF